jgi:hypothetical protein
MLKAEDPLIIDQTCRYAFINTDGRGGSRDAAGLESKSGCQGNNMKWIPSCNLPDGTPAKFLRLPGREAGHITHKENE